MSLKILILIFKETDLLKETLSDNHSMKCRLTSNKLRKLKTKLEFKLILAGARVKAEIVKTVPKKRVKLPFTSQIQ